MTSSLIKIDQLSIPLFGSEERISLLRCDEFDLEIPGNKYWKLKYNVAELQKKGQNHLVTFGGAFSNHIAAVASAGKKYGFRTTGIIRGEESSKSNHTLLEASKNGMDLRFIDRSTYRNWKMGDLDLSEFLGESDFYLLPEGGTNTLAVKGCMEIMHGLESYDLICCSIGSGGTMAGLISGSTNHQQVLGFSSLKNGQYMEEEIANLLKSYAKEFNPSLSKSNWKINHDYHFGGFAKVTNELVKFYRDFLEQSAIELDLIYTAKMMYGLRDLLQKAELSQFKKILVVHSGGQQGNSSLVGI